MMIVPGSAFIPKAASGGDPYWGNVVLLMHMDGANDSTSFIDETGKTITPFGAAKISTAKSKFGGASAYFSGVTNDYLRTPTSGDFQFDLGTAYTIEYHIYLPSAINSKILLGNSRSPWIWHRQFTQTSVGLYLHGSEPSGTTIDNTWHHIALVFDGTNAKRYIDGTYVDTNAQVPNPGDDFFSIGGGTTASGGATGPECYIDELRITKGVARYTADFTVPSTPFPNS